MWFFGKKISINKLMKDEDQDEAVRADEEVSFAPRIETEKRAPAKKEERRVEPEDVLLELPSFDDPDDGSAAAEEDEDLFPLFMRSAPEEEKNKVPEEEASEEKAAPAEKEETSGEESPGEEPEEDEPEILFDPDLFASVEDSESDGLAEMIAGIVNKEGEKEEQTLVLPAEEFFTLFEEKGTSVDAKETPEEIFERLTELPYTARTYALYEGEVYLSSSDGEGGLYLFEEFGEFKRVQPGDCRTFIKLPQFEGTFRGKTHKTADLEYIMEQHAMKLLALAYTPAQNEALKLDGYLPERRSEAGKGRLFSKAVSLYRMKDLTVRADLTTTFPVLLGESYYIAVQRQDLEAIDCEKQYKRFCQRIANCVLDGKNEPFFSVQVLKVCRNLAVCFPLEGTPRKGDRFAGGEIAELAELPDGSYILQIGQDETVRLPLTVNTAERGQHRIELPEII